MNFTLYNTLNKLWHISEYIIYLIHIYVSCTNQYCTDYQWPFQQKVHLDHGIVKDDIAEKCVIFDKSVYKVKKTLCKNDTFSRFCHALDKVIKNRRCTSNRVHLPNLKTSADWETFFLMIFCVCNADLCKNLVPPINHT